jgi:hypothetical protein
MPNVTYSEILALRAEADSKLYAEDKGNRWDLKCKDSDKEDIFSSIPKQVSDADGNLSDNPLIASFTSDVLPMCNAPVFSQEVRFQTHDYSKKADWDGRTHGDQVAYLAGAYLKHPVDGSWLDATGASMIGSYANPADPHYGDPSYLFGAYAHRITAKYDDVNYRWLSANGTTRYAWLDLTASPPEWKDDSGAVVVHYNGTDWIRNDTSAVVTSSLWRILPYPGYKIQINKIKTTLDVTVAFTGVLHYQVYMNLASGVAGPGYPAGKYQVADWNYKNLGEIIAGSDADPYIEPDVRAGHTGKTMIMNYDYQHATKAPVIDDMLGMHLDISLSDNMPVTGTVGAGATFICMKIRSF